jgi:von Willebrand factor type A domain
MADALNQADLAFVVDTTGSMGAFIDAAKRHMVALLRALTAEAATPIDLRLGVVEYRDHPPQDHSFVTRTHAVGADLRKAQKVINGLAPAGGGDAPEAVYDGLRAACTELEWRPHSRRLAVLVGDAPPHGTGCGGDGFRSGCPCGLTAERVTALLEEAGVTLYALGLTAAVRPSFTQLATWTGGEYFEAARIDQAIESLRALLAGEFEGIDFDRRVLELCAAGPDWTVDGLGAALDAGRHRVAASLSRLGRRGFLRTVCGDR